MINLFIVEDNGDEDDYNESYSDAHYSSMDQPEHKKKRVAIMVDDD